jgi:hypothetical protein
MAAATATSLLLLVSIRGLTTPANVLDLGREGFVLVFEIPARECLFKDMKAV